MDTPIKGTPILKGKDAAKFEESMRKAQDRKVPAKDYQRAKEVYIRVKQNSESFV